MVSATARVSLLSRPHAQECDLYSTIGEKMTPQIDNADFELLKLSVINYYVWQFLAVTDGTDAVPAAQTLHLFLVPLTIYLFLRALYMS